MAEIQMWDLIRYKGSTDYCVQLNIRCERRKMSFSIAVNLLLKRLLDVPEENMESIGFGIIFLPDHEPCCRTSKGTLFHFLASFQ